jgi:hypothetical protein
METGTWLDTGETFEYDPERCYSVARLRTQPSVVSPDLHTYLEPGMHRVTFRPAVIDGNQRDAAVTPEGRLLVIRWLPTP